MAFENTSSAYHWYGNFGEKFPSNGTYWYFFGTEKNFSLSLDMKPGTSNPGKCYRKFRSFR